MKNDNNATGNAQENMPDELVELREEVAFLKEEREDMKIIYETALEHSSLIENELEEKNTSINALLLTMKKYLSPQLYKSLVGGETLPERTYKRRRLTVFFSDIANFTEITDMMEAEALSDLLNQYLDEMSKIALKYGGTIDKFIGDAIMIFFGDPEFIDDETHARQCVLMALEMMDKIHHLSRRWVAAGAQLGLAVRMGINTGYCTVGNFGSEDRMDYTIIGGEVNISSRLEHIAENGSVYISGTTYHLVKHLIRAEYMEKISVKGVHYPIEVYKVLGLLDPGAARADSLLELTEDGFQLPELCYSRQETPVEEKDRLIRSLEEALDRLQRS